MAKGRSPTQDELEDNKRFQKIGGLVPVWYIALEESGFEGVYYPSGKYFAKNLGEIFQGHKTALIR